MEDLEPESAGAVVDLQRRSALRRVALTGERGLDSGRQLDRGRRPALQFLFLFLFLFLFVRELDGESRGGCGSGEWADENDDYCEKKEGAGALTAVDVGPELEHGPTVGRGPNGSVTAG